MRRMLHRYDGSFFLSGNAAFNTSGMDAPGLFRFFVY
jgi:hypothetical protein